MGVLKDPLEVEGREGSIYPEPFGDVVKGRFKRALGNVLGLNNFGVNMVHLAPGGATAQRHWHEKQDELVYVLEGEATLITDAGEQLLTAGMVCGFPAGEADGHHIVNKSDATVVLLEVGDRADPIEAVPPAELGPRIPPDDGQQPGALGRGRIGRRPLEAGPRLGEQRPRHGAHRGRWDRPYKAAPRLHRTSRQDIEQKLPPIVRFASTIPERWSQRGCGQS